MVLTRVERFDTSTSGGGWGHAFEEAATRTLVDHKEVQGHRRIVKVKLGSLTLLVRSEVDAIKLLDDTDPPANDEQWDQWTEKDRVHYCEAGPKAFGDNKVPHLVVEMKTKRYDKKHDFDW